MWGRERRGPQDQVVAARMNAFFGHLTRQQRADPQEVARCYAIDLAQHRGRLLAGKHDSRSPYYVGLSAGPADFIRVTKRVTLVTDTMLLTEHRGSAHQLGLRSAFPGVPGNAPAMARAARERYAVVSEDLAALGCWLLDAEPLLRTGLAWFCPQYVTGRALPNFRTEQLPAGTVEVADYLIEHGRAVDLSTAKPLASRVVRPVLEIDLPFLDGLSLADFARVTREEFDSYRLFRDFMRARLLELDGALEAEDSQVQLERLALAIREEVEAARTSLTTASRTRALTRAGAVVSSTGALLAAVRPDALAGALATTTTAVSGLAGLWPVVQAYADRARGHQGKWHYVWVLHRKAP
ncbi:hypothetical protein [Kitasatospora cineracea]|uniref:Uncharacterized protein n=1 Tax=Kitasatospora cineracea TaxID=88074 RepID=A0A3N4SDL8_9ACTN|nr:hypothetical protein [Kitasatospora cineracea]RPE36740.1 hypothetical protein EDD38_5118 [Kitasatospora cineracea]